LLGSLTERRGAGFCSAARFYAISGTRPAALANAASIWALKERGAGIGAACIILGIAELKHSQRQLLHH